MKVTETVSTKVIQSSKKNKTERSSVDYINNSKSSPRKLSSKKGTSPSEDCLKTKSPKNFGIMFWKLRGRFGGKHRWSLKRNVVIKNRGEIQEEVLALYQRSFFFFHSSFLEFPDPCISKVRLLWNLTKKSALYHMLSRKGDNSLPKIASHRSETSRWLPNNDREVC